MFGLRVSQFKRNCSVAALAIASSCVISSAAHADGPPRTFDIPQESASKSLIDFSKQSGLQIMAPYDKAAKITTPAVKGDFTPEQALAKLLDNSGLEIASRTDTTIYLRIASQKVSEKGGVGAVSADTSSAEVIVTGTHIRNANPTSPVHVVTQLDIDQSGYSQIGDLMRSLPENFGGGNNPGVFGAAGEISNQNTDDASTINLRGLGTAATLVLLNGHRLSGEAFFQGSDISGIPLSAVERIEVVTDGASALYGSDAVAGVVNIILKKQYQGLETGADIGAATQGGGEQQTYSALAGTAGPDWNLMANAEYSKDDGITAGERQFTSQVTPDSTLIDPQERRSLFVSGGRELSDAISVSFDGLLNDRSSTQIDDYSYGTYLTKTYTPAYSGSASLDASLAGDWRLHATGVVSGSHNSLETLYVGSLSHTSFKNFVSYGEATADGTVLSLPSGPLKLALGGGYRVERFQNGYPDDGSTLGYVEAKRNVSYVFAEVSVPLVSPSLSRTGLHRLELNVSGRAEDYSDFGKTANPKVGIRYLPLNDLTLRASAGTSFRAPSFQQMYESYQLYLFPAAPAGYVGGNADSTALIANGGNPDLKPERSKSWTVGADYTPSAVPSLSLSATYFNIDFTGKVFQPINPLTQALSGNPEFAPFVDFDPSASELADLVSKANVFINYTGAAYNPANVVGVAFNNYQNAASQFVRGVDASARDTLVLDVGRIDLFANATWLQILQRVTVTSPDIELTGTIFNAPKFKARGGLSFERGGWTVTGIVNYISAETDTGVTPNVQIASWTTADATAAYKFKATSGGLKGVKAVLAINNVFDKNPPRAVSPSLAFPGTYFDSTNTSVIGRFVSLAITKAW